MSYGAFATPFNLGLRRVRTGAALAGMPGPAETPARVGEFPTHRLSGMGVAIAPNQGIIDYPIRVLPPPTSTQTSPTPTTSTPSAQPPTPVAQPWHPPICPAFGCNIVQPEPPRGILIGQQAQPSSSTQTTPTPQTPATSTTPATGVALTSGAAATAQAGTPVPVGYPTNQAFVDSSGNIWTYTATGGWQLTTPATASVGAASSTPSVSVSSTTADWVASLTTWLQGQTIISGVSNFWIVAGVGIGGLLLWPSGRRR